jgi:hypothetical protein
MRLFVPALNRLFSLSRAEFGIKIVTGDVMKKSCEILKATVKAFQRYHLLLVVAGLLIIAVVFYGLHDRGMIMAYVATAVIIVEITYRWRKIRYFLFLALGAFLSSIFFSFLHEAVVKPMVGFFWGGGALDSPGFDIFHVIVTYYILFVGIMGIVIGVLGTISLTIYKGIMLLTRDRAARGT